jgi:hypothetical protein
MIYEVLHPSFSGKRIPSRRPENSELEPPLTLANWLATAPGACSTANDLAVHWRFNVKKSHRFSNMRNLSTTFALLAILLTLLLTGRAAMSETSKGASVGQDKPNEVGEEQAAAVAQFARNFPSTFHFGGRLTGSIVTSISKIDTCDMTTSQGDPNNVGKPDESNLDFADAFWLQIAVQKNGTKSEVSVVHSVKGQIISRAAAMLLLRYWANG